MIVFYAIAALFALLAVVWLTRPLLWPATQNGVSSQRLNADIYRDQLRALDGDLARGTLSATDHATTVDELQLRLLDDTDAPADAAPTMGTIFWTARRTAIVLALMLPLGSAAMYWWLGTPAALDPGASQRAASEKVKQMVEDLATKLKAEPNNPMGWAMLARSYKVLGRLDESELAFAKAMDVVHTNADLLVEYADLLAVRAQGNLEGQPLTMINQALSLSPQHPMALMLSGVAAYRRADYAVAAAQWEKLLAVLEPGSPDAQQIEGDIADARAKAGLPPTTVSVLPGVDISKAGPMTPEKILQMVDRLAARLKANPDDPAGWERLAKSYRVLGRTEDADKASANARQAAERAAAKKP
jgi:cytochrome c-type biogenesis protein CcmH